MEESSARYRTGYIADVLKRKKEGNSTPRSPLIFRIKRSKLTASRRNRSFIKREKGDNSNEELEGVQMKNTCIGESSRTDGRCDLCVKCKKPGLLMYCDGKNCKRCYHLSCIDPHLSDIPFGMWYCVYCLWKKLESGVHSVSQGIESILDSKNEVRKGKHYLVKYKGLAHIHNRWVPEIKLLRKARPLLEKFNTKQERGQKIEWKHEWTTPHRLLQRRSLVLPERIDLCSSEHGDSNKYSYVEWLVKWKGLGYEYSTWEFENSECLCSADGKALMDEFKRRRVEARKKPVPSQTIKDLCIRENLHKKLAMLADELPIEHNNEFLPSVCNIIKHWYKKKTIILILDQEAKVKSILFISYLLSYSCHPFLIISTIPSLSNWEAEFARLAPSINIVVYSGNKKAREMIRSLEFYEEGGCVMFKVLITSPDVIVEDLQYLDCLVWEGITIDDYQKKEISEQLDKFAILSEFKLLISNGVPKRSGPALKDCNSSQSAYAHGAQEHDVLLREENPEADQFYSDMKAARNSQEVFNPAPLQNQMIMMSPSEHLIARFHEKRKSTLAAEREKELEEVRKKYNHLLLNEEQVCNQNLKLVKELQSTSQKNIFLAELLKSHSIEPCKHGSSEEFRGQMGNLKQMLPKKDIPKMPTLPSSSSSALPFPFPPPGMGPPSTVVTSLSVPPACMQQSNNASQRNLTSKPMLPSSAGVRTKSVEENSVLHAPAPHIRNYYTRKHDMI